MCKQTPTAISLLFVNYADMIWKTETTFTKEEAMIMVSRSMKSLFITARYAEGSLIKEGEVGMSETMIILCVSGVAGVACIIGLT